MKFIMKKKQLCISRQSDSEGYLHYFVYMLFFLHQLSTLSFLQFCKHDSLCDAKTFSSCSFILEGDISMSNKWCYYCVCNHVPFQVFLRHFAIKAHF